MKKLKNENTKRKVINGDSMKIIEEFDQKDTQIIYEKYQNAGKWSDISIDIDGDIVLFLDL